ncbi:hypothetical protein BDZ91DRAFT_722305 [Kalaharituber pfeilii]|nr:hypothetical protein BDZ91DRAFT_722305 [Kalaharituber pfeilii]
MESSGKLNTHTKSGKTSSQQDSDDELDTSIQKDNEIVFCCLHHAGPSYRQRRPSSATFTAPWCDKEYAESSRESIMDDDRRPSSPTIPPEALFRMNHTYFDQDESDVDCISETTTICMDSPHEIFFEPHSCDGDSALMELVPSASPLSATVNGVCQHPGRMSATKAGRRSKLLAEESKHENKSINLRRGRCNLWVDTSCGAIESIQVEEDINASVISFGINDIGAEIDVVWIEEDNTHMGRNPGLSILCA